MAALSFDGAPGVLMHQELLAQIARALALLQHPFHYPCPHTLHQRRYSQKAYRQYLKLPPVSRAQVGSVATGPLLWWANAFSVLQIRPGDVCFAVLEVLSLGAFTRAVQGGGLLGRFARARAARNDWLVPSMSFIEHMHENRVCNYVFRAHAR